MRLLTLQEITAEATDLTGIKPIKILEFPESRQSTNFSCGASSIQSVLYYYGIEVREDKLIKLFDAKPTNIVHSGIDPDHMKDKLEKIWKLSVDMRTMSLDDIREYLDRNIPVILAMQAWRGEDRANDSIDYSKSYSDGHYIVAIGYSDKHMIFDDPSILSNRAYLPFDELEQRWHDEDYHGNKFEHLGLAVYGKEPVFDKNVYKKIL